MWMIKKAFIYLSLKEKESPSSLFIPAIFDNYPWVCVDKENTTEYIWDSELNKPTQKQQMQKSAKIAAEKYVTVVRLVLVWIHINNRDKLISPLVPVY